MEETCLLVSMLRSSLLERASASNAQDSSARVHDWLPCRVILFSALLSGFDESGDTENTTQTLNLRVAPA